MRSSEIERIARALATVPDPTELLSSLFENVPIGLAVYDKTAAVVAGNQCYRRVFGDRTPNAEVRRVVERCVDGELVHITLWFDGHEATPATPQRMRSAIEVTGFALRSNTGIVTHVAISFLDVTAEYELRAQQERALVRELVRENQQLDETSRQKSAFLASVSHELRTPLHTIIGYSDLLYSGKIGDDPNEYREAIGDILESGRNLLRLIDDVIDLARIEAGKIELRPERVTLSTLVDEVRTASQPVSERPIAISVDLDPTLTEVTLDPVRFKQVLFNYVSNAIKYVPDDGQVTIRTIADGPDWFRVEVEDTGDGIAPEDLDRLFTEFAQIPGSRRERGTGIGLALTRRLVEAQGGTVGARSAIGRGSVFHARLPRSPRTTRMQAVVEEGN